MDSGGSGSLQSSSGGDDQEYDSAAVSSLFASISNPNPIPPATTASSLFHPSPPQPFSAPNPLLYNMDPVWSTTSDPNFNHSLLTTPPINQSLLLASYNAAEAARVVPPPQQEGQGVALAKNKNPKKRTRASRRAPTTVLTTDTSNFRQMVQEFTGIPAAPFSAAPFTLRLDLFGGGGGPSAPPSDEDHLFAKQPQSLLNLQNPLFTFQSLLLQQQQQPLPNSSANNSVADGQQQVHTSLGGLPTWGDHHGGEDENFGDFEGNNENSQNVKGV